MSNKDRLAQLKQERAQWFEDNPGRFLHVDDPRDAGRWSLACPDEAEELAELEEAAGIEPLELGVNSHE